MALVEADTVHGPARLLANYLVAAFFEDLSDTHRKPGSLVWRLSVSCSPGLPVGGRKPFAALLMDETPTA
jgi:hypothetical protein